MKTLLIAMLATPVFCSVITSSSIDGIGTTAVSGWARVEYTCWSQCPDPPSMSISTLVSGITTGPQRPGYISIFINGGGEHGRGWADVENYSFNCAEVCIGNELLPFTLGVSFDILAAAAANQFGGGLIDFRFTLYESNMVPVPVYTAHVPELAAWKMVLLAMLCVAVIVSVLRSI